MNDATFQPAQTRIVDLPIDREDLVATMQELLKIPSPSGFTDEIVQYTGARLEDLGIPFELTRRGAIRADLAGRQKSPDRAIVSHLDTLGAMVTELKPRGRLRIAPIGSWSARFAEGARCTLFTDSGRFRGTILPLLASGHTYGEAIDKQDSAWDKVELRVDAVAESCDDLKALGIDVGDNIAIDPAPEITGTGFITSRHLDDKAGVACVLAATKAVLGAGIELPLDCHLLFTISEEVGSGASHVLHGDVSELVAIDNATVAPSQNSSEMGVTLAMMDSSGPFDYHLTRKLLALCRDHGIEHARDVFRYYRTDAAAAIEAGNDIRTALVCFGLDASHGHERVHIDSLLALARLLACYMQSPPTSARDEKPLAPLGDFPATPDRQIHD